MRILFIILACALCAQVFAQGYPVLKRTSPFSGSRFYVPNDNKKHTTLLMLHGSEGGSLPFVDAEAEVWASQGFAVLVFCYFDCGRGLSDPSQTLKDVEVTQVLDAVAWIRTQSLSNQKVIIYGFSRGAELAMLLGSLDVDPARKPNAIIAHSPSDVSVGAFNWDWARQSCWLCTAGIDKCDKNSGLSAYQWNKACGPDDPNKVDPAKSAWLINAASVAVGQRIEIEKYDQPILITVGDKDQVWPYQQTQRIEARLKAAGRPAEVHYFAGEGHVFADADELVRRQLVLKFLKRVSSP